MTDSVKKIMVIEDDRIAREFYKDKYAETDDLQVAYEAGNIPTALELLEKYVPDLIVLDLGFRSGGKAGVEALPDLKQTCPDVPIFVVSQYSGYYQYVKRYVMGYLYKEEVPDRLIEATRQVLAGELYFSSAVIAADAREAEDDDAILKASTLTRAEKEILIYTAEGKQSKEIAELTGRSKRTVEVILSSHIYQKLGFPENRRNKVELVKFAIRANLIKP
ncbi:MAG: response regulator transcription factor [Leptospiraceae bacterium]|nr:response regulator transcription factor [Leptospiraceae bacterium]